MVGGTNFERHPFNLATNGHRQPGSSIKPFILATALQHGIGPGSVWASAPKTFRFRRYGKKDVFVVRNFQNRYSGSLSLADATAYSDNSVFAEIGMKVGPKRVARTAAKMGIRTPLSTNPAMLLGGLKEGVTPLEMAYAYSTIANTGKRVSGTLASASQGPVAIEKVVDPYGHTIDTDRVTARRVYSTAVGRQMRELLHGVVMNGTGKSAQVGAWSAGKTGTTENYGDAWFCGFTDRYTTCVWVGYADRLKSMSTEYNGAPVEGGTFPAEIWADLMSSVLTIDAARHPNLPSLNQTPSGPTLQTAPQTNTTPAPSQQQTQPQAAPQQQTPAPQPQSPPPSPGGGGGGGGGGGTGGGGGGGNGGGGGGTGKGGGAKPPASGTG
jgi:penicillin-binding protein 1A